MSANRYFYLAAFLCTMLLAAGPTTRPQSEELKQCWADLASPEPLASGALLRLSQMPDAAIDFLRVNLRPLTTTPEELDRRLADLGSDDPSVWKPAFDELCYFDPRITRSLADLMDVTKDPTTRNRLVAVLSDRPADDFEGETIEYNRKANNFRSSIGSWWAEKNVERLNAERWGTNKVQWTRAVRAIALLRHFNTPNALSIVKDMATGNEDAFPTKVAKGVSEP